MQDTKHKVKALDKSNCAVVRPGGKEAGVKPTSSRTEMGYEAGDVDELARQSEVLGSASQVKPGVVLGKFTPLPGETCPASRPSRGRSHGTVTGNRDGGPAGVSSGRSNAGYEPAVSVHPNWGVLKVPEDLTHARRTKLIRTAETATTCRLLSRCGRVRRRKTAVIEGIDSDRLLLPQTDDADYGSIGEP